MNKNIAYVVIVIALIIGLFMWGNSLQKDTIVYFEDTNIACLSNGHQSVQEHIHPILQITVDGQPEAIPANVGIRSGCMSEVHTHDATGKLHIETFESGRIAELSLADFFAVWNTSPIREGYDVRITLDGEEKDSVEEVGFRDGSVIELAYTSTVSTDSSLESIKEEIAE